MMDGRCGCGAVKYSMKSAPLIVHCCHCRDCQRSTGSAFVLNAIIEADHVEVRGQTIESRLETPSGKGQILTRCAACGVTVFSSYMIREGKLRYVRVGTLDNPAECPPDVHIFTSSKQPWLKLDSAVPVFEEFYVFADVWSEAAQDRWKALFTE